MNSKWKGLAGLVALLLPVACSASTYVWTGAVDTAWSHGGNWNLGSPPGPADSAEISLPNAQVVADVDVTVASVFVGSETGMPTLTIASTTVSAASLEVDPHGRLELQGGALSAPAQISGTLVWTGGTLSAPGGQVQVLQGGLLSAEGDGAKALDHDTTLMIDIGGTFAWSGGNISLGSGASISIYGLMDASNDDLAASANFLLPPVPPDTASFHLSPVGVLQVSGYSASQTIGIGVDAVDHGGITQVYSGTLRYTRSLSTSGTLDIAADANVVLGTPSGGSGPVLPPAEGLPPAFVFLTGAAVEGDGMISLEPDANCRVDTTGWNAGLTSIDGGTIAFEANATTRDLTIDGGTRAGTGSLTVTGGFGWASGTLADEGMTIVGSEADLTMVTSGQRHLAGGHVLDIAGSASWEAGGLEMNAGSLVIEASGDFDCAGAAGTIEGFGGVIENHGVFGRGCDASPTGTTTVQPNLLNMGSAGSLSGSLILDGGSLNLGTLVTFTGPYQQGFCPAPTTAATLTLGDGTHDSSGGVIQSSDTVVITGTDVTVGAFDSAVTRIEGGNVQFLSLATSALTVLEGGTIRGAGNFVTIDEFQWMSGSMEGSGTTSIATHGDLLLSTLDAKSLAGGRTLVTGGLVLWPDAGALQATASHIVNTASGHWIIAGDGDIGGTGSDFTNAGIFEKVGTPGTSTVAPSFTNTGTVACWAGTLQFDHFTQEGGVTALHDATIGSGNTVVLNAGRLIGRGTIAGSLYNGGTVAPGFSEGKLTITNNYTQASTGTLELEAASAGVAGKFDQVAVGGTAALDGTVNVTATEGYTPAPGDKLDLLTAGAVSGQFSDVNTPTASNGAEVEGKITGTSFTIVAPVAIVLSDATTIGTQATVNVSLGAGPACVRSMSESMTFSPVMTFVSLTSASGCTLTWTPGSAGTATLVLTCPSGQTGTVPVGTLTFNLPTSAARSSLGASASAAVDCAGSPNSLLGSCVASTIFQGCLGDLFPDGTGGGGVTLQDFVLARRKVSGGAPLNSRDTTCGDLHPGRFACSPTVGARAWCPDGDDTLQLPDAVVIRQMVAGVTTVSCQSCALAGDGQPPAAPRPGDLAPRERPDGQLDVADVVAALRVAVGLDELDAGMTLRADIAPAHPVDGTASWQPDGNGQVDVGDVVLMLRGAVGLVSLEWPLRELVLAGDSSAPFTAFVVRVQGWPSWAEVASVAAPACEDPEADGLDRWGDRFAVTCITDAGPLAGHSELAVVRYRAPRAVEPGTLSLSVEATNDALDEVPIELQPEGR